MMKGSVMLWPKSHLSGRGAHRPALARPLPVKRQIRRPGVARALSVKTLTELSARSARRLRYRAAASGL
jgi:hypothetical protein